MAEPRVPLAHVVAIATEYGYRIHTPSPVHWQILQNKKVLVNIWPTKLKVLFWTRHDAPKKASEMPTAKALLQKIRSELKTFKLQPLPESKKSKGRAVRQSTPVPEKDIPDEAVFTSRARHTSADLSLDGNELRIIINGAGFTESIRLTKGDTAEFLNRAVKLKQQLKESD